jgi:hypothetical protein
VVASAFLLLSAGLALFRYYPALRAAVTLDAELDNIATRIADVGLGMDRATTDELEDDLTNTRADLADLDDFFAHDPLVSLARALPPTSANVHDADAVLRATSDVLAAAADGLTIVRQFDDLRQDGASEGRTTSVLTELGAWMVRSRPTAIHAARALASARRTLNSASAGDIPLLRSARTRLAARIENVTPLMAAYVSTSERLPMILGWEGPRRYLVLSQDPAELRPTGGFVGTFGILAINRGRVTERRFHDVFTLDLPWDYPVIRPPQELADYLLGPDQPWQLGDGNWSPDFPTSAADALRLYENESGDADIDGVLGITTYTIDELIKVTGPVTVPRYGVTIAPGQTTLKALQLTRRAQRPNENRKAFLSALANRLFAKVLALPASRFAEVLNTSALFQQRRLLLGWFKNPADEALAVEQGFDGSVSDSAGDLIYPVDSNVAPVSKLNAMTTRSLGLEIDIDSSGNARHKLKVTWANRILSPAAAPYRALPDVGRLRVLGMYFRLLIPSRSRIQSVSGGGVVPVTTPAVVETEAGRLAVGNYLRVRPGKASLRYAWITPAPPAGSDTTGSYHLTIQYQPGVLPGPLSVTIQVPAGFRISNASTNLLVSGPTAMLTGTFDRDISVYVAYSR